MKESFVFVQFIKVNRGSDTIFSKRNMEKPHDRPEVAELRRLYSMRGSLEVRLFRMQDIVELDYSACRTSRSSGQETADLEFLVPNK